MLNPPLPKISTFSPNKHFSHNKHTFFGLMKMCFFWMGTVFFSVRLVSIKSIIFSGCDDGYICLPDIRGNPDSTYGYTNYDHIGYALLTSFQLLTLDFWENTYNMILRASGTWNVIYFILVILLGPFYLLNLLLAVVTMARVQIWTKICHESEIGFLQQF